MKKSREMLEAEAKHYDDIAQALYKAHDCIVLFTEAGEGGWGLRCLVRKILRLHTRFAARAATIREQLGSNGLNAE